MPWKYNPFTDKLDRVELSEDDADAIYLKLDCSNDPLTGELEIDPATGDVSLRSRKAIILTAGQKLYFDGT